MKYVCLCVGRTLKLGAIKLDVCLVPYLRCLLMLSHLFAINEEE